MPKAKDIINGALRLNGVIATGEAASAGELSDALSALNNMIDSWSNDGFMIFSESRTENVLNPPKQTFTIGPGGDFDEPRPMVINHASIIYPGGNTEVKLKILNEQQWASTTLKSTESTIPLALYYNPEYPLGKLSLWPVPTGGPTLVLHSLKPLLSFETADSDVILPPGYMRALQYNLAIEIGPEYGKEPKKVVLEVANESKALLMRQNTRPVYLSSDSPGFTHSKTFNWLTGE
jgi:hypothetical protein